MEQLFCLRHVDTSFVTYEEFIHVHLIPDTKADTTVHATQYLVFRMNVDSAAIMGGTGHVNNATNLTVFLLTVFTHCHGHIPSLAIGDVIKYIHMKIKSQ